MIDLDAIRAAIIAGLKDYLGVPVIRSNQTGKPPAYPYASYTITSLLSDENGTWGKYEDETDRKPMTQGWSVTVQSDDAAQAMQLTIKARDWFDHVGSIYLHDHQIIVQSLSSISNRDNLLSIEYEYRNGFDIVFWLLNETKNPDLDSGTIESATIQYDNATTEIKRYYIVTCTQQYFDSIDPKDETAIYIVGDDFG